MLEETVAEPSGTTHRQGQQQTALFVCTRHCRGEAAH